MIKQVHVRKQMGTNKLTRPQVYEQSANTDSIPKSSVALPTAREGNGRQGAVQERNAMQMLHLLLDGEQQP